MHRMYLHDAYSYVAMHILFIHKRRAELLVSQKLLIIITNAQHNASTIHDAFDNPLYGMFKCSKYMHC